MKTPLLLLAAALWITEADAAPALPLDKLRLPPGHQITVAARVSNARQMALGPEPGLLFVGSRRAGTVSALQDRDGDGVYEHQITVATGLEMPSGIAVRGDDLYVAALDRVLRYPGLAGSPESGAVPTLVTDQLPTITHHGWKYLKFGPDGMLYFNLGAPCNVCLSEDQRFASILRLDPDSGEQQVYAAGVRNGVGFAWHPVDNALWFTDNGRDHLGDDLPDDELNRADQAGLHFGYPFVHAGDLPDPTYGTQGRGSYRAPKLKLGAHVAPLGLTFYTGTNTHTASGKSLPNATADTLFIAEHGSWNRSAKVGYRVVRVETRAGEVVSHTPFIEGWLQGQRQWGRPVDVVVDRDGSLLISDDYAGAIYRVRATP